MDEISLDCKDLTLASAAEINVASAVAAERSLLTACEFTEASDAAFPESVCDARWAEMLASAEDITAAFLELAAAAIDAATSVAGFTVVVAAAKALRPERMINETRILNG